MIKWWCVIVVVDDDDDVDDDNNDDVDDDDNDDDDDSRRKAWCGLTLTENNAELNNYLQNQPKKVTNDIDVSKQPVS